MLIKIIAAFFAITIGIIYGISFIYFDRLSQYFKEKGEVKKYYKFVRLIFVWSILIIGFFIVFILQIMFISMLVGKEYILKAKEALFDIYYYIFPPTFFITLFVLYKMGKLKNTKD